MRLLKSFLLGTIASSVLGQDTPVCPEGWAIGQNKCYKENISKIQFLHGRGRVESSTRNENKIFL